LNLSLVIADNLDPSPSFQSFLTDLEEGTTLPINQNQIFEPLDIDDGFWKFTVEANDWVGNFSSKTVTFEVIHDMQPPRTSLVLGKPKFESERIYVCYDTSFTLKAIDDLVKIGDEKGLGVKFIEYQVKAEPKVELLNPSPEVGKFFQPSPFNLSDWPEGEHKISYVAEDIIGNREEINTLAVILDTSPPVTIVSYPEDLYFTQERVFATSKHLFGLISNDALSGVNHIEINPDLTGYTTYQNPVSFETEGEHLLNYKAVDNVENWEEEKIFKVTIDTTPPTTEIMIGEPRHYEYVNSRTEFNLTALDGGLIPCGVKETGFGYKNLELEEWKIYSGPFNIIGPDGHYIVGYVSIDNLDNAEETKSIDVKLDNTAPETSLAVIGPRYEETDDKVYISGLRSAISLSAVDPVINEVASGVKETKYLLDTDWLIYLSSFTLEEGIRRIQYYSIDNVTNEEATKSFTVYVDSTPPISGLSLEGIKYVSNGKTYITSKTQIRISGEDPISNEVASGIAITFYKTSQTEWKEYTGEVILLPEGIHTIRYYSIDLVFNKEEVKEKTFHVDNTPPVTSLTYGNPYCKEHGQPEERKHLYTVVSSLTPLRLEASDPIRENVASGVKLSRYRIPGANYVDYTQPFNLTGLADGDYTITYYSIDNVENIEPIKSITLTLDNTPPVAKLVSPSDENIGLCKIVNGTMTIMGTVSDLHFKWYKLEYQAVGSSGWVVVKDKTYQEIEEGILATWDTNNLAEGWYKIRLTAQDCVLNEATDEVEIYVGKPNLLCSFGKIGNASGEFNSPSYIVHDSSGNIWVSDTNNDRVQKFDSQGNFLFEIGSEQLAVSSEQGKGKGSEEQRAKSIEFNKPTGLAIDSQGNLYVADRNNDRVVIFDSFGKYLREIDGSASLTTSFNKPHGLAISKEQRADSQEQEEYLYVADRNNDRVQKFDKEGNLVLITALAGSPTINTGIGFDTLNKPQGVIAIAEEQRAKSPALACKSGINSEQRTKLYVTDRNNDRILVFSSTGGFLSVIGSSGTLQGQFNKPDGVWANSLGYIYIADSNNDRIQKFDKHGNFVMSFAGFNKPAGITLDEQGNLYVVDSNNAQVKVFGLPGTATIVAASPASNSPSPLTEFKLGDFYSFPNPAKYGKNPTIHFECGIADGVEIRIYDVAGDLIHSKELLGNQWTTVGGKYCYEYTWDISDVASGVYIYCIQAKKSGYPEIKVKKKLAVIK